MPNSSNSTSSNFYLAPHAPLLLLQHPPKCSVERSVSFHSFLKVQTVSPKHSCYTWVDQSRTNPWRFLSKFHNHWQESHRIAIHDASGWILSFAIGRVRIYRKRSIVPNSWHLWECSWYCLAPFHASRLKSILYHRPHKQSFLRNVRVSQYVSIFPRTWLWARQCVSRWSRDDQN